MKKVFIFCVFLLTTSVLFAKYTIKIAVYKDEQNLMSIIAKIPEPKYRKNIVIKEKNHLHYVTSISYEYEKEVTKALRAYKKVFPDAFVEEVKENNITIVPVTRVKSAQIADPLVSMPEPTISVTKPVVLLAEPVEANTIEVKKLLENKTVYLYPDDPVKDTKKEIMKLDFKPEYVWYSKRHRDTSPLKIAYRFDKNRVILTMSEVQFSYQLLKEEDGFLVMQSYVNAKTGERFRFYFDENAALSFMHNH